MATPAGKHGKPKLKRYRKPKSVPPPKPRRAKRGDLKKIYKELVTTNQDQRVNTLTNVMHWYDAAIAYLSYKKEGKWPLSKLKNKNSAEKEREKGINSHATKDKELHFMSAVSCYEQMLDFYKPPKLSLYLRKLKSNRKGLRQHTLTMEDKHGKFLKQLDEALKPVSVVGTRIRLSVDKLSAPYRISSEGDITFDRKLIISLRRLSRKQGFLSAVINLLPVFSETASREVEVNKDKIRTGRFMINEKKRYLAVLILLNHLNHYAMSNNAPRSIVRRLKPIVQTPETASKAEKQEKAA